MAEGERLIVRPGKAGYGELSFKNCTEGPFLSPSPYDDVSALDPAHLIELSPALSVGFELVDNSDLLEFTRHGRSIIPLALTEMGTAFREVTRVSLLGEHIVLCHEAWFEKVKIHLSNYGQILRV